MRTHSFVFVTIQKTFRQTNQSTRATPNCLERSGENQINEPIHQKNYKQKKSTIHWNATRYNQFFDLPSNLLQIRTSKQPYI